MRNVRFGVTAFRSRGAPTENVDQACAYVEQAGRQRLDLLCLPECFPGGLDHAEKIDGETITRVSEAASFYGMYVICPIVELRNGQRYNAAVVLDREGNPIGSYDKTHLTRGEIEAGLTPGDDLPVFELDFGRIAIATCYDLYFADPLHVYGQKGTDILFWPSINYGFSEFDCDWQFLAKAIDHGYYVAASDFALAQPYAPGKAMLHTFIGSPEGAVLADTGYREGVVSAEVDLDSRWLVGTGDDPNPESWQGLLRRQRRAELYGVLSDRRLSTEWAEKDLPETRMDMGAVCLPENPERDLEAGARDVQDLVGLCADADINLICLPENCLANGAVDADSTEVPTVGAKEMNVLRDAAVQTGGYLVAPVYRARPNGRPENVALVFDGSGQVVAEYAKTHLNDVERDGLGVVPGNDLPVLDFHFGKVGVLIGEDILQPEAARALALQGAEVILWCGSPMPYWPTARMLDVLLRARALDCFCGVVAANFASPPPYKPGKLLRTGRVIDDRGQVRADTGYAPGVVIAAARAPTTRPFYGSYAAPEPYEMRAELLRLRRPELYAALSKTDR